MEWSRNKYGSAQRKCPDRVVTVTDSFIVWNGRENRTSKKLSRSSNLCK